MALNFKVGSFNKSTGAAPVVQTINTLGFDPTLLLFFSMGGTVTDTWVDTNTPTIAILDPTLSKNSISQWVQDGGAAAASIQNIVGGAGGPLKFVGAAGATTSRGDVAFVSGGFEVTWSTNDAQATLIHYIALGGSQLNGADLQFMASPAAPGSKSETGFGFAPQAVLPFLNDVSTSSGQAPMGFGAYQTGSTWTSYARAHWGGPAAGATSQQTTKVQQTINDAGTSTSVATITSIDPGGYTANWTTRTTDINWQALGIKGPHMKVGSFTKSVGAAPASQAVTGLGFAPKGILLVSTLTSGNSTTKGRFALGAADNSSVFAEAWQFQDATTPINTAAVDSSTLCFIKADNDAKTIEASATLTSLDSDGFTLSWGVNDAVATPILYFAWGAYEIPVATTGSATLITPSGATLNGTINPGGATISYPASYKFEYGLTTSYGSTTTPVGNNIGSLDVAALTAITGLSPNTLYHFRVVAFNDAETVNGLDATFTTLLNDPAIWVI